MSVTSNARHPRAFYTRLPFNAAMMQRSSVLHSRSWQECKFMLTLAIQIHADGGVLLGLSADEQVARRLQAEYDREMAAYLVDHPDDAAMRRMAGHAFNPSPQPSTNTAQSTASQSAQQGAPRPSSTSGAAPVRYPAIGSTTGHHLQSSHAFQSTAALWHCCDLDIC